MEKFTWGASRTTNGKARESGLTRLMYPTGKCFTGSFKNDVPHGIGELKHPNGKVISGRWEEGRLLETF
jgi:hypothetical protein